MMLCSEVAMTDAEKESEARCKAMLNELISVVKKQTMEMEDLAECMDELVVGLKAIVKPLGAPVQALPPLVPAPTATLVVAVVHAVAAATSHAEATLVPETPTRCSTACRGCNTEVAITCPAPSLGAHCVCADTCIVTAHQVFDEMPRKWFDGYQGGVPWMPPWPPPQGHGTVMIAKGAGLVSEKPNSASPNCVGNDLRRQGNMQHEYTGRNCVPLEGAGVRQELISVLRYLRLYMFFSKRPYEVFLEFGGYGQSDILIRKSKARLMKPAFTVVRDECTKCFLVFIRGAITVRDRLTGATAAEVPFHHAVLQEGHVSNVVVGHAHCGMVAVARWIANQAIPCLSRAIKEGSPMKVVSTSLLSDNTKGAVSAVLGSPTGTCPKRHSRRDCPNISSQSELVFREVLQGTSSLQAEESVSYNRDELKSREIPGGRVTSSLYGKIVLEYKAAKKKFFGELYLHLEGQQKCGEVKLAAQTRGMLNIVYGCDSSVNILEGNKWSPGQSLFIIWSFCDLRRFPEFGKWVCYMSCVTVATKVRNSISLSNLCFLHRHCAGVNCLAYLNASAVGTSDHLFTGNRDGTLKRWELKHGDASFSATFESHVEWVNDAIIVGQTLVSCSSDTTLKVWNCLLDGACTRTLRQHADYVICLAAAEKSSNIVASGGLGGEVCIWDLDAALAPVAKSVDGKEDEVPNGNSAPALTTLCNVNYSGNLASSNGQSHGYSPIAAKGHKDSVYALAMNDTIWVATTDSSVYGWPAEGNTPQKVFQKGGSFLAGNLSFSRAKASLEGSAPVPIYKEPSFTIPGVPAIIQHEIMNNRRHVLTKDTAGSVKLWEVTRGAVTEDFGKVSFEDKKKELFEMVSIPAWFAMDARLGCLSVHLDTPQCFSAEIYAVDLNVTGAQEDLKINLAQETLRGLLVHWSKRKQKSGSHRLLNGDSSTGKDVSLRNLPHPRSFFQEFLSKLGDLSQTQIEKSWLLSGATLGITYILYDDGIVPLPSALLLTKDRQWPWDPGGSEVPQWFHLLRDVGLGTSRNSRREECHEPA